LFAPHSAFGGFNCPAAAVPGESVRPVEQIDFYFDAVRMKAPVSHMAAALVPTFRSFYGTFSAPCATDHNALLEALVRMTVDAEQNLEKDHSISGHGIATYDPTTASGSAEAAWALARTSRQPDPSRLQGNTNA
jgi:hypothetical protein